MVAGVDVQHVLPCGLNPLGWYGDEPEDKRLDAAGFLEPELLDFNPLHDGLVEVAYQCCQEQEHSISAMKDFGSLFHPNPLFMSSKIRSLPPRMS